MKDLREMELVAKAREYFQKHDYQRAQSIFNEILESNDRNVEAYYYLANIFNMKGEISKAIKAFEKVLKLDPNHTDASIGLSILYNDIGRYDQAQRIFERASQRVKGRKSKEGIDDIHINKKFSIKHYELADLYFSYNRYDEALFEYNKAYSLDPDNLQMRIKIAKVYAKKGFVSKAFDELKKIKNERPDYMPARLALGVLYYGNGRIIEAQNEWQMVLSKEPSHSEAAMYMNLSKTAHETAL